MMKAGFLKKINFAMVIFAIGAIVLLAYLATYLAPVTDNAFVISNVTPVASMVKGYISEIYVTNGQTLKKGDPILKIHQKPYELEYQAVKAQYDQALVGLKVLGKRIEVTRSTLKAAQDQLDRMRYEYELKSDKSVDKAIMPYEIKSLEFNIRSQTNTVDSIKKQIELEKEEVNQAQTAILTLKAALEKASMDLDDTIVRAKTSGYIQNLFAGIGTPVISHEPLFQFVDTNKTYIQANFNETDLADVKAGDKVLIYPRTYLGRKKFHGVVMSNNWTVDRKLVLPLEDSQFILEANHWLNLPQRLPVQIMVLDVDEKYPLRPGMSAYVYIQTK